MIDDILANLMALSRRHNVDISITLTSTEPGVEWHWIIAIHLMRDGNIIKRVMDSDSMRLDPNKCADLLFNEMLRALNKEGSNEQNL